MNKKYYPFFNGGSDVKRGDSSNVFLSMEDGDVRDEHNVRVYESVDGIFTGKSMTLREYKRMLKLKDL